MLALWRCCHPGPTVAVTAFTTLLAVGAGRGASALWVAAAVLAGQLSVGWSNDWVDRHRDRAVGRRDKPLVTGEVDDRTVISGAVVAVAACAVLSLPSGLSATAVHLLAVGSAWAYNLGVKSTLVSVVPYAVSFGLLPAFVTLAPPLRSWPPGWALAAGALQGAGAHFTNVLDDLDRDAATGIRGLPHRLGRRATALLAAALLAGGGAVLASGTARPLPP
ncbi:MAG: UbiA family prenyltransferase, partial [Egibacteraceae bacterium]